MWEGDQTDGPPEEREIFLFKDSVLIARATNHDSDGEPTELEFDKIIKVITGINAVDFKVIQRSNICCIIQE